MSSKPEGPIYFGPFEVTTQVNLPALQEPANLSTVKLVRRAFPSVKRGKPTIKAAIYTTAIFWAILLTHDLR